MAVSAHVPVPLVMVMLAVVLLAVPPRTPTVQTPAVPVMAGATAPRALVVAVTRKVDWYAELAGAPVNVTVGVAILTVSKPEAYVTVYIAAAGKGGA